MSDEHQHNYICEKCGNEAEMILKEEARTSTETKPEQKPKQGIIVCKVCGNEADMILEEI